MKTTKAQIKKMINTMEVKRIDLKENVALEVKDIEVPLQALFDNCMNFISGDEDFVDITL